MTMKKEIWGFYPPPIGGISIYCKRLVEKMHAKDNDVVMRGVVALVFFHYRLNISYVYHAFLL